MSEIGSAFLTITADTRGLGKSINTSAGGTIRSSGKSLGATFGKAFLLGGSVIAAAGIGSFLKGSIDEAREAQKVGALTANVIKTTGGAAKITAAQVGDLATALSNKTGIDDEAIQSGSNLLLTFKNIKREGTGLNDVFGRATAAAVDLSASGFGDINGASKQLGKALNDPVKGITALGRSGVTFTDGQKEQIKTLVASGKTLEAQKIILKEVESQVGGSAAATSTYGEKASVAFGNIKEQVGTKLLPVIDGLAKLFLKSVPTITKLIDGIGPAFRRVQAFLAPFIAQVRGFFAGSGGDSILSGVTTVVASLRANFLPVFQAAATTFQTVVLPALRSLGAYLIANLLPVFKQVADIIITRVIPIVASLAKFMYGALYPAIFQIVRQVAGSLKPVFDQLVATFQAKVLPALDRLFANFQKNQPAIQKVVLVVVKVIGALARFAAAILGKVLPPLIRLNGFIIGQVVGTISTFISAIGKIPAAAQKVAEFVKVVKEKITNAIDFVKKLPGKITDAVSNFGTLLYGAGQRLISGLIAGITSKIKDVGNAIKGVAGKIKGYLPGSPIKEGPLTSWNNGGAGERLMDMLAKGILSGEQKVTKAIEKVLNKAKGQLDTLVDAFSSVMSGVSGNFASNLFGAVDTEASTGVLAKSAAQNFLDNLTTTKGNLSNLIGDFSTLKGFGLSGKFLAQLFSDGGYPLIHELAADQGQASAAGSLFADIQNLSTGLGNTVASGSTGVQTTLDKLLAEQKRTNRLLEKVPAETGKHTGDAVNGAATAGKGRGNKGKGK